MNFTLQSVCTVLRSLYFHDHSHCNFKYRQSSTGPLLVHRQQTPTKPMAEVNCPSLVVWSLLLTLAIILSTRSTTFACHKMRSSFRIKLHLCHLHLGPLSSYNIKVLYCSKGARLIKI